MNQKMANNVVCPNCGHMKLSKTELVALMKKYHSTQIPILTAPIDDILAGSWQYHQLVTCEKCDKQFGFYLLADESVSEPHVKVCPKKDYKNLVDAF